MADGSLARRYARALLSIGQEGDLLGKISADLLGFQDILDLGDGELRAALANPGITTAERRAVLEAVLGALSLNAHSASFLRLLLDKGRFFALDDIIREYGVLADEIAGRVRATVTTAKPLTKTLAEKVAKSLEAATGKTVEVT
jgi:F-type H+-transporting ATPase subunit delta